jgi:hypothetical protein
MSVGAAIVVGAVTGLTLGIVISVATDVPLASGPAWFRVWGAISAALILSGVLIPLDVPGVDEANFIGYVLWSLWLVALATLLVRGRLTLDRSASAAT